MKKTFIGFLILSLAIITIGNINTAFGQHSSIAENALTQLMEGDFAEAKNLATGAIKSDQNNGLAYAVRGRALFVDHNITAAQTDLEKAIKLNPDNGVFQAFLADCYRLQDNLEQSKKSAQKAISLLQSPKSAIDYYSLGIAYFIMENQEQSLAGYGKAIELNPRFALAFAKRGVIYADKKQDEAALADFEKAIAINPKYSGGYFSRANVYFEKQKYDQAITDYSKVIELDPQNPDAYFNRGVTYKKKEQYDLALADYAKVAELSPKDVSLYKYRARLYVVLQKYDLAIADYSKAISLDPKSSSVAYIERGNLYFNNKQQPDLALADYIKAIEISPKQADGYNNIGAVYNSKQQFSLAITNFTKSIEADPKFLLAYINRADSYDAIGSSKLADLDRKKYSDLGGEISATSGKTRRSIYPQGSFDAELAKSALSRGLSKIMGKACSKVDGLIFMSAGVKVVLFPVTPYFEEWHALRDKKEDKNTGVYMSVEANKYAIEAVADEQGRFSFEGLKPGKYFIQIVHNFNQRKTQRVYTGVGTAMEGPTLVTTNYYYNEDYIVERSQRLERFVEIKEDGETKKIVLSKGLIKGCAI